MHIGDVWCVWCVSGVCVCFWWCFLYTEYPGSHCVYAMEMCCNPPLESMETGLSGHGARCVCIGVCGVYGVPVSGVSTPRCIWGSWTETHTRHHSTSPCYTSPETTYIHAMTDGDDIHTYNSLLNDTCECLQYK